MDVTCERCATEYEFDDALVSEKGTTVKCTTCGHQFKVRRSDGVKAPERWVVRTLDGRELEFRALRELQSAIAQVRVTRDDVLSRGTSRPRRLGSIAELEPFFATAGSSINAPRPSSYPSNLKSTVIGVGPRERSTTPAGLGDPRATDGARSTGAREESSVAIPLPRAWVAFPPPAGDGARASGDESPATDRDPVAGSEAVAASPTDGVVSSREAEPVTARRVVGKPASTPPSPLSEERTQPFLKRAPVLEGVPAGAPPPIDEPPSPVAASPDAAPIAAQGPGSEEPSSELLKTHKMEAVPKNGAASSASSAPLASSAPSSADVSSEQASSSSPRAESSGARPAQPPPPPAVPGPPASFASGPPSSDPEPITHPRRQTLPVESKPRALEAPPDSADEHVASSESPVAIGRAPLASSPGTPTPSDVRVSYMMSGGEESLSEPRFSSAAISRASGGIKLIVALVVGGALVFLLVLFGRRFLAPEPTATGADAVSDERVSELLAEGLRQMDEGDLFAAKEQLDKASALAERDPRVAEALAKLAVVQGEVPWLRLRLLEPNDPEREVAKRELAYAIVRVEAATKRAQELAPSAPEVTRIAIDAKRLAGERGAARELIKGLEGGAANADNAFVLGALDLAEDQPPWPTVVDRLTQAAAAEKNLGRARALLVYALARSKEIDRARAEYDKLAALPRAHPLLGAFRGFLDRAAKGDVEPVDVDSLPDVGEEEALAAPAGDPGAPPAGSFSELLAEAHAARASGDLSKAEELYVQALTQNAGNSEAQAGLADIARARGQSDKAMALYQKVLSSNGGYLPAMVALADLKWSSGDQAGAKAIYLKILQQVSSGPIADLARERLGQGSGTDTGAAAGTSGSVPAPSPPASSPPAPSGPVPDDYVAPDQPSIDTTDLPGHPSGVDEHI